MCPRRFLQAKQPDEAHAGLSTTLRVPAALPAGRWTLHVLMGLPRARRRNTRPSTASICAVDGGALDGTIHGPKASSVAETRNTWALGRRTHNTLGRRRPSVCAVDGGARASLARAT